MKKVLPIIVVAMLLSISFGLMACKAGDIDVKAGDYPTQTPTTQINKDMKAMDMVMAGIDNFYGVDYVATELKGVVTVKVGIEIEQIVVGTTVRKGSADSKDVQYFVDNKSASVACKVYEETIIKDGKVKFRNANSGDIKADTKNVEVTCKKFNDPVDYTLESLVAEKKNDPTKIWMYGITKDSALGDQPTPEVKKDEFNNEYYEFTVDLDYENCTKEYVEVMKYMMEQTVTCKGLDFKGLKMTFQIWKNGFFRQLEISETYQMKVGLGALGSLNSNVTLNSVRAFYYNDKTWDINDYINRF